MRSLRNLAIAATALGAGCTPIPELPSHDILIPNETLNISKSLAIPAEGLVAGALLYVIVDPLAPNWRIEEVALEQNRYRIALKKKRFTTGGDGEAVQIFNRRAAQLVSEQNAASYRIVAYSEGIESSVPFAQRVAQGVVEVVR